MAKNSKEYMKIYMKNYRDKDESKKEVEKEIVIKPNNKIKKELKEIFIGEDDDSPTIKDLINKIAYNSSLIEFLNKELESNKFITVSPGGVVRAHPYNSILSNAQSAYNQSMKLLYNITKIEDDE